MEEARSEKVLCPVCRQAYAPDALTPGDLIPERVAAAIRAEDSRWTPDDVICATCLNRARMRHAQTLLEAEKGRLSDLDMDVLHSIGAEWLLSSNPHDSFRQSQTWGERLSDRVAASVGSWYFATTIALFLAAWIGANLRFRPFEPYPVVILAVISAALGSLAAIQGPIILMSQRRQARLDRLRAENDYRLNLKAELEIRYLGEKIDHFHRLQHRQLREIEQDRPAAGDGVEENPL